MRIFTQDLNDITDSKDMLETKPHSFIVSFIYIFIAVLLVTLIWAYFFEIDEYVKASGVIRPGDKTVTIRNSISGKVDMLNIEEGKHIKKGDTLFTINAKGLIENKKELNSEIEKLNLTINNLTKFKESINTEKNLFDKNNENESYYYNLFQKYETDKKINNEQFTNSTIDINKAIEGVEIAQKSVMEKLDMVKLTLANLNELKASIENDKNMINSSNKVYYDKFNNYITNRNRLQTIRNQKETIYNSYKELFGTGSISIEELENAKNQLEMADLDVQKYKNEFLLDTISNIEQCKVSILDLEESTKKSKLEIETYSKKGQSKDIMLQKYYLDNLIKVEESLASNRDNLTKLQSQLKSIELNLAEATVLAPIDGIISMNMQMNSGELLQSGAEIATIIPETKTEYKVQVFIYNKDIGNIKEGQEIQCRLQALPYSEYGDLEGVITNISSDARVDTQNGINYYIAEASLNSKPLYNRKGVEANIKLGMTCDVQVITKSKKVLHWMLEKINLKD